MFKNSEKLVPMNILSYLTVAENGRAQTPWQYTYISLR